MWTAEVSRRELLESLMVPGSIKPSAIHDGLAYTELATSDVMLIWSGTRTEYPSWIIIPDEKFSETYAAILASPQIPSPISSLCRVVRESEFKLSLYPEKAERESVLNALVGMALAEAAMYSGGTARAGEMTPAACSRTVSFAFCKALKSAHPQALSRAVANWLDVQNIVNPSAKSELIYAVCSAFSPIFTILSQIYYGMPQDTPILWLLSEVLENGEASPEAIKEFGEATSAATVRLLEKSLIQSTREERALNFQEAVRALNADGFASDNDVAACAFIASQIAPGSFEHLGIVASARDPRLAGWYGVFAALGRGSVALRAYGGLGVRVRRDALKAELIDSQPTADISYSELKVAAKGGLDSLARRLSHSNEIIVELVPLVSCSFRFGQRAERAGDLFGEQRPINKAEVNSLIKTLSSKEKIDFAISLLSDVAAAPIPPNDARRSPAKTRRRR